MIIPMQKYSFLIFHKEYDSFLKDIQNVGVVHIIEKKVEITQEIKEQYKLISNYEKTIKSLEKRNIKSEKQKTTAEGEIILKDIIEKQNEETNIKQILIQENRELKKVEVWGDFSKQLIEKLHEENISIRFFVTSKKNIILKKFQNIQQK